MLSASPGVDVQLTIDAAGPVAGPVAISAVVRDGGRMLGSASGTVSVTSGGTTTVTLSVGGLSGVTLWSPDTPKLYQVTAMLVANGVTHSYDVNTGFRQATFATDGFHLNGQRLEIFGLNRHQLFPYTGMAASARLQRRDAEILRTELNCNMVRCSHYPQSPDFLDACDELGLMVWEEPPGWQYIGDAAFQDDRAPERAGHGDPRPQPAVGDRLGHAAERDQQQHLAVRADPRRWPRASTAPARRAER